MNIYAEQGDKVIFANPNNGYNRDKDQCARLLTLNAVYTVDYTDVGDCHTDVGLKEFPEETFNSVMFDDYDNPNTPIKESILLTDSYKVTHCVPTEWSDDYLTEDELSSMIKNSSKGTAYLSELIREQLKIAFELGYERGFMKGENNG